MKNSHFIDHQAYNDIPVLYGKHAPYWQSLSFSEKVDTIRRVGLFGFLRETCGMADSARIHTRLEVEYSALLQRHEADRERISTLEQAKQELEQQLAEVTAKLETAERAAQGKNRKLLTPPSAKKIMNAFNRMCPEGETWFYNPYEEAYNGNVCLTHRFKFYPFDEIRVPRGKLRLCDQYGDPVCLTQNYDYSALPPHYADHLVPYGHQPYRLRVLFITRHNSNFWLDDPRTAQDVVLEIRTHYKRDDPKSHRGDRSYESDIKTWKERYYNYYATAAYGMNNESILDMIISIEKFLSGGNNNFSKTQIDRIRDKCYTEYLDFYFGDKYATEDLSS